jgi:hypothetical protein
LRASDSHACAIVTHGPRPTANRGGASRFSYYTSVQLDGLPKPMDEGDGQSRKIRSATSNEREIQL